MTGRTTLRLPFALLFITALLCRAQDFPGTDTVSGRLLASEPTTVTDPLDFSGLASTRLPLVSQRAFSWTDVRISLQGSNVTDTYQPGRTIAFPDPQAVGDVVLRGGLNLATSPAYGTEIVLSAREPGPAWHGRLSSGNTGSPLASSNLPPLAERGMLQQPEHYRWFTREGVQAGGPLGKRADLLLSGVGQWASQTVPQARPGEDLNSRLISGDARGRVQLDQRNQLEASFDTTHIFRSNWGTPAGLEALAGYRMSPSFTDPAGFSGLKEMDSLGSLRAGYTRGGAVQVRYGFSRALLNTTPTGPAGAQSVIDLVGAVRGDTPPLTNRAARTRHQLDAVFTLASGRHRFLIGGGWERAGIVNGWSAPSNLNLITALGVPDFVVMLNTPTDSRSHIQAFSASVRDEVRMAPWLAADIALVADIARGGTIAWNSASPRAGLSLTPLSRLTLRGSYSRTYAPLAGRYLDYGNAASLGGTRFQWIDRNADGLWQPSETSRLLGRFGGPYSNIDRDLRRPHADQFDLGAEASLPRGVSVSLRLFRRDEKARIAAVNVGVPPQAFSPVQILDPGPDAKPGTFDDQELTVYAQDPSTLGRDQYLLTNPPGLRMLNYGLVAEAGGGVRFVKMHASFMAVKSYGPTNPGNGVLENDPGVVGALFQDPNTAVHASGRTYFDRAYVGKAQAVATLPRNLGGIELATTAIYLDGLVFGRRLLVTGLPQGPFLVATTVRGSPEGGNRAEYALNWNLRLGRSFPVRRASVRLSLDLLNVLNAGNRIQEMDASGPLFNQRLPVAIQSPRFLRFNMEFLF